MGIDQNIDLTTEQRATVLALLKRHLPGTTAWVYGSRAKWTARPQSDLDLVVFATPEQHNQVGALREAFEESNLPFRVELFVWNTVPESFREQIEAEHAVLVEKDKSAAVAGGWVSLRLGDVCTKIGSGATPRGGKEVYLKDGPFSLIRSQNVHNNRFSHDGLAFITEQQAAELNNVEVFPDDVLLNITGDSVARACQVAPDVIPARVNQHVAIIRPDASKLSSRFLRYFLVCPETQNMLLSWAGSGGTRNALTKGMIESLDVYAPANVEEQRAIAHVLGTLDDKIELNRRMNETLEAMARALYKSWFVDFDPVRAKAALRNHAAHHAPGPFTPPLSGSQGDKGASPQASRWGETGATPSPRPWPDIKRQYTSRALQHAQAMRQSQTNAEGLLWYYLRSKQLGGYKFRRQQPIGPYVADFACLPEKLLIELDGGQHADPNAPDAQRDRFLRQQGYRVLRFWNHEVFADCFGVLESIYAALTHHPPLEGGSKDASLSERGSPLPLQPAPDGLASATPPQGGRDWSVARARAYLDSMDPEIAALFPDRFVDSELGEIPAGWEIEALGELIELAYGKALKADDRKGGSIPVYGSNGQVGWHDEKFADGPGIVVGRKGNPGVVTWVQGDFFPIDTTFYVVPRDAGQRLPFLYFALIDQNLPSVSADSAVPGLSRNLAYMNKQLVPATMAINAFCNFVNAPFARHHRLQEESSALATLRDALLPKLVSGELRVRKMEAITR